MSIEITQSPDKSYLVIKISGILGMEQLKMTAEKLASSTTFSPDINCLYDMTEMDFSNITPEFEKNVIAFRQQLDRGNAKIACVTPSDVGFGMGRTNPKLWGIEPPPPTKKRK